LSPILSIDQIREISRPPVRIVSLVPSSTESVCDLGFGDRLVGITDFCIHPAGKLKGITRVGGPKSPAIEKIAALKPDLILANREENERASIETLAALGWTVWVSFPRTVRESIEDLVALAGLVRSDPAMRQVRLLENAVELTEFALLETRPWRYFCPIWEQDGPEGAWWMTFNQQTYSADLLRLLGGENVFSRRERRYPLEADLGIHLPEPAGERDTRYPRVRREDVLVQSPDVILLPSEPFEYGTKDIPRIATLFEGRNLANVVCVDGTLLTWCGTRLGKALAELPGVLEIN